MANPLSPLTRKFRRSARSPFAGATASDLRMFRGLATGVRRWERAAQEGRFYLCPYAPEILQNDGGLYQADVLHKMQERAWDRLMALPQWPDIQKAYRLEWMRRYEPQAYEVHQLREELARHKAECRQKQ